MKAFKDGDVLLVPHFPENGLVTIAVVDGDYPGCYEWKVGQPRHLNHGIKVKKVYGLQGEISMYNQRLVEWYGKLSGLRLPIKPWGQVPRFFYLQKSRSTCPHGFLLIIYYQYSYIPDTYVSDEPYS
jgi:hypothetical protein